MKSSKGLRVAISAGGTGGHVFPAVALAEEIERASPGARILLIGTRSGPEFQIDVSGGRRKILLDSPRLKRGVISMAGFGASFAAVCARAYDELSQFRPQVVVGTGGYGSVAPVIAARLLRRPVVLLEQNVLPGRANRVLARFADEIHIQFEESRRHFPGHPRVIHSGNPVRRTVLDASRRRLEREGDGGFTLFVMGGSQGASSLNRALADALPVFARRMPRMTVLHVAGSRDAEAARRALRESGLKGKVWDFCGSPDELYARADLAVFRAGATAIAEASCAGLPAVLVPYPHAAEGHQELNARALERAGAAVVIDDAALSGDTMAERVLELARDRWRLTRMSAAMRRYSRPDAGSTIAQRVARVAAGTATTPERRAA